MQRRNEKKRKTASISPVIDISRLNDLLENCDSGFLLRRLIDGTGEMLAVEHGCDEVSWLVRNGKLSNDEDLGSQWCPNDEGAQAVLHALQLACRIEAGIVGGGADPAELLRLALMLPFLWSKIDASGQARLAAGMEENLEDGRYHEHGGKAAHGANVAQWVADSDRGMTAKEIAAKTPVRKENGERFTADTIRRNIKKFKEETGAA